jgi:hypothetical protein
VLVPTGQLFTTAADEQSPPGDVLDGTWQSLLDEQLMDVGSLMASAVRSSGGTRSASTAVKIRSVEPQDKDRATSYKPPILGDPEPGGPGVEVASIEGAGHG